MKNKNITDQQLETFWYLVKFVFKHYNMRLIRKSVDVIWNRMYSLFDFFFNKYILNYNQMLFHDHRLRLLCSEIRFKTTSLTAFSEKSFVFMRKCYCISLFLSKETYWFYPFKIKNEFSSVSENRPLPWILELPQLSKIIIEKKWSKSITCYFDTRDLFVFHTWCGC